MDRDGFISNGELFLVLKMMVGNNLKVCMRLSKMYLEMILSFEIGSTTPANC